MIFAFLSWIIIRIFVTVHGRLKLENRNWKLGLHGFELLMNVFNFGPVFCRLVPRLCLGILYTEALPHKQEAKPPNRYYKARPVIKAKLG